MPKLRAALIGFGLGLALTAFTAYAVLAADKGGPRAHDDIVAPKADAWTGPYIGIGAGWSVGSVDLGAPFNFSQSGPSISGVAGYDKQWGGLVGGVGLGYSHYFGDLESAGINHDIFGFARLGVLVTPATLLYGHLGYGQLDTDAGKVNGFRFGPGVEMKLSGPFSIDLRWTHGVHDVGKFGPNLSAESDEVTGRLNYRF